jgi:predicted hotdog family 3-hydroxylacyl-ACP dehydratase
MSPLDCLPHQPPLRVLERVDALSPREARASFRVATGPLTRGQELWSGALIEGLAQTAALLGAALSGGEGGAPQPIRGLLVGLRKFVLGRPVKIGEEVTCAVTLVTQLGGGVLVQGLATVDGETVASGRLQFVMEPLA